MESTVEYNIKTKEFTAYSEVGKPPGNKVRITFTGTEFRYAMQEMARLDSSLSLLGDMMGNIVLSGEYPIPDLLLTVDGEDVTWETVRDMTDRMRDNLQDIADSAIAKFEKNIAVYFFAKILQKGY